MTDLKNRVKAALKKNWLRQEQEQWIYGKLGRVREGLDPEYEVKGRKNFLYVTIRNASGAQTAVPARNDAGVPYTSIIQVKVKLEYGVYVIGGRTGKADEGTSPTLPPTGISLHASTHKNGGADEVATATAAANAIPKAGAGGELAVGWITLAVGSILNAATGKTTPVDADTWPISDSAASGVLKKVTGTNLKAYLKTYFDTIYSALSSLAAKTTPVDADSFVITDSAAADVGKRVTGTNVKAYLKTYFDTLYDLTSTAINLLSAKTTPIDADSFVISDSAASGVGKKVTGTNLKVYLKAYFDTLYGLLGTANTWTQNNAFNSTATSGFALSVLRNLAAASTDAPVVSIWQDHASDDQNAINIRQDGTGNILSLFDGATEVFNVVDGGRLEVAQIIRAKTSAGMQLQDDGGNSWMTLVDGGKSMGIATTDIETVHSDYAAIQFGLTGLFLYGVNVPGYFHADNAYYDGAWKRRAAGLAAFYSLNAGEHAFLVAVTGAANSAITWIDRVRIGEDGVGIGTSPIASVCLALSDAAVRIRMDSTGNSQTAGFVMAAKGSAGTQRIGGFYWTAHETADSSFFGATADNAIFGFKLYRNNRVAIGSGAPVPQGTIHAHDGLAGDMFVSLAAVVNVARVIIPNATGDVVRGIRIEYMLFEASGCVSNSQLLHHGITTTFGVTTGGSTWTWTLNANGELSVIRSAGAGTADIAMRLLWI